MRVSFFVALLFATSAFAQTEIPEPKKLKKEIGVKGIKEVLPFKGSSSLFIYKTKKHQGLYDSKQKKILADTLIKIEPAPHGKDIIYYQSATSHVLRVPGKEKDREIVSAQPYHWTLSRDTFLVVVHNTDCFGFLDLQRNDIYSVNLQSLPKEEIRFFEEEHDNGWEKYKKYCDFNPTDSSLTYSGYREDGVRDENYLKKFDNYLIEERSGYRHFGFIHNRKTGERKEIEPTRYVSRWRKGYYMGYSRRTFYDFDFNPIYQDYSNEDYSIRELEDIIGEEIQSSEQISDYFYLLQTKEGYAFYNIDGLNWSSNFYTELYPAGHDVHMCGMTYFTRKDKTIGLYNTSHGEIVPPNYTIVETRILANGAYAFRANNEIFQMGKVSDGYCNWRLVSRATAKRTDISNSTPINHASVRGDEIVLSLRKIRPDTHDSYYYTESNYQDASGIYNFATEEWSVQPKYHTFFPYKDRYIVSKNDHFGHRYTAMEIWDKEMKTITTEKYGGHVIYMGKLYAKNDQFEMVEVNVENGKEVRNLGKLGADGEDFKIWCNHLLIGSINYEDNEREYPNGFEVQAVINALGDPIVIEGWEFHGLINDGMVMMVKYKMDGREKARDARDKYIPEAFRVYDLNRKKFLSPEYNSYNIWSNKLTIWMDTNERERAKDPEKLQKYIEIPFANLRTFYTTM